MYHLFFVGQLMKVRRGGFNIRPVVGADSISALSISAQDTGAEIDSAPTPAKLNFHYNFLVFYDRVSGIRY